MAKYRIVKYGDKFVPEFKWLGVFWMAFQTVGETDVEFSSLASAEKCVADYIDSQKAKIVKTYD